MKNKKITLIGINYSPEDTAIGLYSTQMMEYLNEKGFEINVVTGFPYYPKWEITEGYKDKRNFLKEEKDGITIFRYKQYVPSRPTFLKRILHLLDFTIGSFFNILKIKETDIVITIVPFTSSIFLGWLLKLRTKSKLWVHIQDFEFDAALQAGVVNGKSHGLKNKVFDLLFGIEKYLLSKADVRSSISYTMLEKLKTKISGNEVVYLPNWIDLDIVDPTKARPHNYLSSEKFKILYSGNIGDKQDWNAFLKFIKILNSEYYEIIIVGGGAKKQWLANKLSQFKNVKLYDPVPYGELADLLCSADLHVLFQKNDVTDTVMPSKLLGMMASAKPSLVTGGHDSEVRLVLEESAGGGYFNSADIQEMIDFINSIRTNEHERVTLGNNARNFVQERFSKKKVLESFLDVINK